ncbi:MAG: exodeoxyribonuclease VII small subunit [Rectinema sp.]
MKNFEKRLERLEFLAEKIKEPDLPIEDAMSVFEEGMKLSKGLKKDLETLRGKVEIIINSADDDSATLAAVPFEEAALNEEKA